MNESPLDRLRALAEEQKPDPRNLYEWTVPVHPADLRWLLAQHEGLIHAIKDLREKLAIANNNAV